MQDEQNLNDLELNENEQAEIKGGPKKIFIGGLSVAASNLPDLTPNTDVKGGYADGPGSGGPVLNHNETTVEDEETEAEALSDLSVENDEQVKGGPGDASGTGGGVFLNHNETTVEDEETEAEALSDLSVENDEQVKGGPGEGSSTTGGVFLNHNETTVEDEETETEALADLTVESDEQVKGGPGSGAGGVWLNHNETITEDISEDENEYR